MHKDHDSGKALLGRRDAAWSGASYRNRRVLGTQVTFANRLLSPPQSAEALLPLVPWF